MSIARCIEVIAQSPDGFDAACRQAIKDASESVKGIKSLWIKNAECVVDPQNNNITMFKINAKITFEVFRNQ